MNVTGSATRKVLLRQARFGGSIVSRMRAVGMAALLSCSASLYCQSPPAVVTAELSPPSPQPYDNFGGAVAVSGNTVLVGSYGDGVGDAGAAFVFVHDGSTWVQQAKLKALDGDHPDLLGWAVSLSADTALVGAPWDTNMAGAQAGSAYIFARTGAVWGQQAKLIASDGAPSDEFGRAVSISGSTALIGAWRHDLETTSDAGAAYVFTRSGHLWEEQAKLTGLSSRQSAAFGSAVALRGEMAVVGAPGDGTAGIAAGAAYVFLRNGGSWSEQARLLASDAAAYGGFGVCVCLSGNTAVIGAPGPNWLGSGHAGAAYVFIRDGDTWTQQAKLLASDGMADDSFGCSVAISGNVVLVGARRDDTASGGADSGSVYIFTRSGAIWTEYAKLKGPNSESNEQFARTVAIDASHAIVGTDYSGVTDVGSAFVFGPQKVPFFSQNDPAWSCDELGACANATIGRCNATTLPQGCAVAAAAMLLGATTSEATPDSLNAWLTSHGGYQDGCKVYWSKVAEFDGDDGLTLDSIGQVSSPFALTVGLDQGHLFIIKAPTSFDHWVALIGYSGSGFSWDDIQYYDPWETTPALHSLNESWLGQRLIAFRIDPL